MAYDTYAGLQATVADWLHRTDLTAQVPDFISLAERVINRRLNIFPRELETALVAPTSSRYIALPNDFGQPIAMYMTDIDPREELTYVLPQQLNVDESQSVRPEYWAVDGVNIAFQSQADQAYTMTLRYQQNTLLSDSAPMHATFGRYPDLYLYGALAQAAPYVRDDSRMPMWEAKFKGLLREAAQDASMTEGAANLRTELVDIMRRPYYDGRTEY